jgi:hypothetical protein
MSLQVASELHHAGHISQAQSVLLKDLVISGDRHVDDLIESFNSNGNIEPLLAFLSSPQALASKTRVLSDVDAALGKSMVRMSLNARASLDIDTLMGLALDAITPKNSTRNLKMNSLISNASGFAMSPRHFPSAISPYHSASPRFPRPPHSTKGSSPRHFNFAAFGVPRRSSMGADLVERGRMSFEHALAFNTSDKRRSSTGQLAMAFDFNGIKEAEANVVTNPFETENNDMELENTPDRGNNNMETTTGNNDMDRLLTFRRACSQNLPSSGQLFSLLADPDHGVSVKGRTTSEGSFPECFVGAEATTWMTENIPVLGYDRSKAVMLGNALVRDGIVAHVSSGGNQFSDSPVDYYTFTQTRKQLGFPSAGNSQSRLASSTNQNMLPKKQAIEQLQRVQVRKEPGAPRNQEEQNLQNHHPSGRQSDQPSEQERRNELGSGDASVGRSSALAEEEQKRLQMTARMRRLRILKLKRREREAQRMMDGRVRREEEQMHRVENETLLEEEQRRRAAGRAAHIAEVNRQMKAYDARASEASGKKKRIGRFTLKQREKMMKRWKRKRARQLKRRNDGPTHQYEGRTKFANARPRVDGRFVTTKFMSDRGIHYDQATAGWVCSTLGGSRFQTAEEAVRAVDAARGGVGAASVTSAPMAERDSWEIDV